VNASNSTANDLRSMFLGHLAPLMRSRPPPPELLIKHISWNVCANRQRHPNSTEHDPAAAGFTCGLWMMFHYFTIAANAHYLENINRLGHEFYTPSYNIHELTDAEQVEAFVSAHNIDPSRTNNYAGTGVLMMYADWCVHCRFAIHRYQALAQKHHLSMVAFGAVNCVTLPDVCKKYDGTAYPTILLMDSEHGIRNSRSSGMNAVEFADNELDRLTDGNTAKQRDSSLFYQFKNVNQLVDPTRTWDYLAEVKPTVLLFYSPLSPDSRRMVWKYQKLARANSNRQIRFAAVECDDSKPIGMEVCKHAKYNVSSYPHVRIIHFPSG
jgi:thiol-disulfide isomerase/thioredoxin